MTTTMNALNSASIVQAEFIRLTTSTDTYYFCNAADLIALRRVPARFFGVFMSVNPVIAAVAGFALGGWLCRRGLAGLRDGLAVDNTPTAKAGSAALGLVGLRERAAAIRASFEAIFNGQSGVPVRPEQVHRLQWLGGALHHLVERIEVATNEGTQTAWVLATNVYVKGPLGWRLAAHHASPGTPHESTEVVEAPSVLH